jgi:nitroimidazol reductase NimA-like FMN-containing flavoprotein (pyridoxamine 5'-phosphate oxidase superfamily)
MDHMKRMRRKDREIEDSSELESIISAAAVCRLAMSESDRPYIVPLCFGYKDDNLYFHSAKEGKKLEVLRMNSSVCFEMDIDHELVRANLPCDSEMKYRSVIGFGQASFVNGIEEKKMALDIITHHYSEGNAGETYVYPEQQLANTVIIKVTIESLTGKKFGR